LLELLNLGIDFFYLQAGRGVIFQKSGSRHCQFGDLGLQALNLRVAGNLCGRNDGSVGPAEHFAHLVRPRPCRAHLADGRRARRLESSQRRHFVLGGRIQAHGAGARLVIADSLGRVLQLLLVLILLAFQEDAARAGTTSVGVQVLIDKYLGNSVRKQLRLARVRGFGGNGNDVVILAAFHGNRKGGAFLDGNAGAARGFLHQRPGAGNLHLRLNITLIRKR